MTTRKELFGIPSDECQSCPEAQEESKRVACKMVVVPCKQCKYVYLNGKVVTENNNE